MFHCRLCGFKYRGITFQRSDCHKIPLVEPLLEDDLLTVGVEKSHILGLKVVSHAMNDNIVH